MADELSIKFDFSELNEALDLIATEAKSTARPAAHAGAIVFYDEVKLNVSQLGRKTGNLADSIYRAFSEDRSDENHATYHVSWNYRRAPHGHLVEYGYVQTRKVYIGSDGNWYTSDTLLTEPKHVGAKPFLRPAYDSKRVEALLAARKRWVELNQQFIEGLKK